MTLRSLQKALFKKNSIFLKELLNSKTQMIYVQSFLETRIISKNVGKREFLVKKRKGQEFKILAQQFLKTIFTINLYFQALKSNFTEQLF